MRCDVDFGWIYEGSNLEKSLKTMVLSMVFVNFHLIDVCIKIGKHTRFWLRFRRPKRRKFNNKCCSKKYTVYCLHQVFKHLFSDFDDVGSILGGSGGSKNLENSFSGRV